MKQAPPEILHKVLFILHVALSDLRYLAKGGKNDQAYELGDTLENIPGLLANWDEGNLDKIRKQLEAYQRKYANAGWCEYAKYLEQESPPDGF